MQLIEEQTGPAWEKSEQSLQGQIKLNKDKKCSQRQVKTEARKYEEWTIRNGVFLEDKGSDLEVGRIQIYAWELVLDGVSQGHSAFYKCGRGFGWVR